MVLLGEHNGANNQGDSDSKENQDLLCLTLDGTENAKESEGSSVSRARSLWKKVILDAKQNRLMTKDVFGGKNATPSLPPIFNHNDIMSIELLWKSEVQVANEHCYNLELKVSSLKSG